MVREPIFQPVAGGSVVDDRDDISLIAAVSTYRDRDAFAELCERFRERAFSMALRILRDRDLAEDAVQEALLSLWRNPQTPPLKDACGWILSIVTAKSIDLGRSRSRRVKRETSMATKQNHSSASAAEALEENELIGLLRSQIDALPELERTLLACSYCANMPQREIAKLVGVSQMTVSNKIQQVLERLRLNLSKAGVAAPIMVPLLSSEKLFEAMTCDSACPTGLTERLLGRLDAPPIHKNAESLRRASPLGKSSAWTFAAVAVVAVAAGGAWWAAQRANPSAPIGATPSSVQAMVQPGGTFRGHWDFSKGPPADLTTFQGAWEWQSGKQPPVAGMKVTSKLDAALLLPGTVPASPMMLKIKFYIKPNDIAHFGCYWADENHVFESRSWKRSMSVPSDHPIQGSGYLIGKYIVMCQDDHVVSVVDYPREYPGNRICLTFQHLIAIEVDARSVTLDEIPANFRDPEKLLKDMDGSPVAGHEYLFK